MLECGDGANKMWLVLWWSSGDEVIIVNFLAAPLIEKCVAVAVVAQRRL